MLTESAQNGCDNSFDRFSVGDIDNQQRKFITAEASDHVDVDVVVLKFEQPPSDSF